MSNQINVIHPYKWQGMWVFDDPAKQLIREPLVSGIPEMIEYATRKEGISLPEKGFTCIFSKDPFPGAKILMNWVKPDLGGNVYRWEETGMEGWLCPALLRYFDTAPKEIHIQLQG